MGAAAAVTAETVMQAIRQAILDGEFASRQRLIEGDLSAQFAASRTAVRTALVGLESEGLIERLPNRGARVRAISLTEAVEIIEVRIGLESLVARRASERIDDDQATGLTRLRDDMRAAVSSGDLMRYSSLNQEMDGRLRTIAGHEIARQLLERLRAQAARHQFRLAFNPQRATASVDEHAAIIDAVVARDPDAAEAATRTHLVGVIDAMREHA